jgi:hypothetical protein
MFRWSAFVTGMESVASAGGRLGEAPSAMKHEYPGLVLTVNGFAVRNFDITIRVFDLVVAHFQRC